ncbi:hypothetical protein [Bacillus proteolyticus]|uniref:hypothetical protein n=1 Tax=Bacillus proteolyticus TaxID=2026192 RepID=UPI003D061A0B
MKPELEEIVIPILDLEKFVFSPPGPMGWELSEYEQQKNIVLNESSVLENLVIIKEIELVELPKDGLIELEKQIPPKTTKIDEINDEGIQNVIELEERNQEQNEVILTEIEKPKVKVKIIPHDQPLKSPWLAVALPKNGLIVLEKQIPPKTTKIDEINDEGIQNVIKLEERNQEQNEVILTEIEKPKVKVKIIPHDQSSKSPWLAKLVKNAKENE